MKLWEVCDRPHDATMARALVGLPEEETEPKNEYRSSSCSRCCSCTGNNTLISTFVHNSHELRLEVRTYFTRFCCKKRQMVRHLDALTDVHNGQPHI